VTKRIFLKENLTSAKKDKKTSKSYFRVKLPKNNFTIK
jgi:hypothetical protein